MGKDLSSNDVSSVSDTDEVLISACKAQLKGNHEKVWEEDGLHRTKKRKKQLPQKGLKWKIGLLNEATNVTEYYTVFRDDDIGFDGFCQKLIKESVRLIE